MANVKITVDGALMDGHRVTFKAPCNCSVVEKLKICYVENGTQKSRLFTMKDTHGNDLTGLGNLFSEGAYVDVILDTNTGVAYLQNAATNKYLEQRITPVDNFESDRADLPASARTVKVLNDSLEWKKLGVVSGLNNPISLPTEFNELYVECRAVVTPTDNTTTMSMLIPKCCLVDAYKRFISGGRGETELQTYIGAVSVNKTDIKLHSLQAGTTAYTTTATMEVYYR